MCSLTMYFLPYASVFIATALTACWAIDPIRRFDRYDEALRISHDVSELQDTRVTFSANDITDYLSVAIDSANDQLICGARDAVLRLRLKDLTLVERYNWSPTKRDRDLCHMKGQREEHCHNFVRTLAMRKSSVLVCGTFAYNPTCMWRAKTNVSDSSAGGSFAGVGLTPYGPEYKSTYLMTNDGQLYTAVATDLNADDPSFFRIFPESRFLRAPRTNSLWFNDPTFVASVEIGSFIYLFFREPAFERKPCGKEVVSRVARVCKNDIGGDSLLQDYWTTFNKATLRCADAASRHFNHLQAIHYDEKSELIYATFTTDGFTLRSSAICVYSLSSLRTAFGGPYLFQRHSSGPWVKATNNNPYFDCEVNDVTDTRPGLTQRRLTDAQQYQLMANEVLPIGEKPLEISDLEVYRHIVVDSVRIKRKHRIPVLFVSTEGGLLKKYTVFHGRDTATHACLVEVRQLRQDAPLVPTQLLLHEQQNQLYVAYEDSIVKVSAEYCARHRTRTQCVDARDPYCGWNTKRKRCTTAPSGIISRHYWHQNVNRCPAFDKPVDGGYGSWSKWSRCPQKGTAVEESCLCRTRECDRPKPRLGGADCQGITIQVSNCTRDGGWTSWCDWSACSATCGQSSRIRRRQCSNPRPAFGGATCRGEVMEQEMCGGLPDCLPPTPVPIAGGWSPWTQWSRCSRACGGGIQRRARLCDSPSPSNAGVACSGCDLDYRVCNTAACEEVRRWSEWTPWLQSNSSKAGANGLLLKRYKFGCNARIEDPRMISVSARPRVEEKLCSKSTGECMAAGFRAVDGAWSEWTNWSVCTKPCNNGTQSRVRTCSRPAPAGSGADCAGHARELRHCNAIDCMGAWSCWSEPSQCSTSCGGGASHRVRKCIMSPGMKPCEGLRIDSTPCNVQPCSADGFGIWSGWSTCSRHGVQVRIRPCLADGICGTIPDAQMKPCHADDTHAAGVTVAKGATVTADANPLLLKIAIVGAFFLGALVASVIIIWLFSRRSSNCCYAFGKKPRAGNSLPTSQSVYGVSTSVTNRKQPTSTHQASAYTHTALVPLSSNIYTPPPSRLLYPNDTSANSSAVLRPPSSATLAAAAHMVTNSDRSVDMADFDDSLPGDESAAVMFHDGTLSLRRTMKASLNSRDYL